MGVTVMNGMFDCSGRIACRSYVYLIIAVDDLNPTGDGYMKIGQSKDPMERAAGLRTGCPLPWVRMTLIEAPNIKSARRLEAALLFEFRNSKTYGEWVRVQWYDLDSRRELMRRIGKIVTASLRNPVIREVDPVAVVPVAWALTGRTRTIRVSG